MAKGSKPGNLEQEAPRRNKPARHPLATAPRKPRSAIKGLERQPSIGALLRERRVYHKWTLSEVSAMTGISSSALSKIENELMSPTYQTIIQLANGLDIEIGDLLSPVTNVQDRPPVTARRSVSRQHAGQLVEDSNYSYTYLCSEVAHKRMIPMVVEVRANSLQQIGKMWAHVGEEFIYVLKGVLCLHTEFYEKLELRVADSVYIDSTMKHAFLSTSQEAATILILCSSATPNLAQTLRDILIRRLSQDGSIALNAVVPPGGN